MAPYVIRPQWVKPTIRGYFTDIGAGEGEAILRNMGKNSPDQTTAKHNNSEQFKHLLWYRPNCQPKQKLL